jgi:outer membrane protein
MRIMSVNAWKSALRWAAAAGAVLMAGCSHIEPPVALETWTAPSSAQSWQAPASEKPELQPPVSAPALEISAGTWRMADLIDVALRNNPDTRASWQAARAAAADWQSQRGSLYPKIDVSAGIQHVDGKDLGVKSRSALTSFGPGAALSWLLLDFGTRDAGIEQKRQALLAADFAHNRVLQNVVFQVQQAFFLYVNAKALVKASETALAEAHTNLAEASNRRDAGVATVADVLQAQVAVSQAQLNLEDARGQIQTLRGALATVMGIPVNTDFDVGDDPLPAPTQRVEDAVENYLKKAQELRPDLAAQRARVLQAQSQLKAARGAAAPNLSLSAGVGQYYDSLSNGWDGLNKTALLFNIPIFNGYAYQYNIRKAQADIEAQKAALDALTQNVTLQVWTSYYRLKTSSQRIKVSEDLMRSAHQSYAVALGRYHEGVGSFLELVTAQSSLESARAQRVQARTDWYTALAQLSWTAGMLWEKQDLLNDLPVGPAAKRIK